jgi:hypothetical protein
MPYGKKYLHLLVLFFLVCSSAQPSPNFLACTVRIRDLARTTTQTQVCCCEVKRCSSRQDVNYAQSVKARKYLPCCESVIPFTSVSEHKRIVVQHAMIPALLFQGIQSLSLHPKIAERCSVPQPADVGKEILNRTLRL